MPTILRIGPWRFFFFSKAGLEPAHIHAAAQGKEVKFWLVDGRLASSYGLRPHELAQLAAIVREHRELFLEAWHEYFDRNA